jgi:hypothetical protein
VHDVDVPSARYDLQTHFLLPFPSFSAFSISCCAVVLSRPIMPRQADKKTGIQVISKSFISQTHGQLAVGSDKEQCHAPCGA